MSKHVMHKVPNVKTHAMQILNEELNINWIAKELFSDVNHFLMPPKLQISYPVTFFVLYSQK